MLRSTATIPAGTLRNTFSATTGSSVPVTIGTQFATKSYVDEEIKEAIDAIDIPDPDLTPYLKKDGSELITGTLNYGGVPSLLDPLNIPNLGYVDSQDLDRLKKDGTDPMTGALNMGGFKVTNLANPGLPMDATTKSYVDGEISALDGRITNVESSVISQADADARYLRLTGGTMSGVINMGTNTISGLPNATQDSQAVRLL
jgi:hypothetical protein